MGVYIPNMSKPKDSCWNCKAQYNSVCSLKREHIRFDGILDDCPLIEIEDEAIDIAQDIIDGCKELKERVNKDIVTCGECKYFNLNEWDETISGVPIIVAHEICHKWGNGCKTDSNGFCFMGERRADD